MYRIYTTRDKSSCPIYLHVMTLRGGKFCKSSIKFELFKENYRGFVAERQFSRRTAFVETRGGDRKRRPGVTGPPLSCTGWRGASTSSPRRGRGGRRRDR